MTFVSTPSTSNNDDVSTVFGVSTTSPQVSTANLSYATVYAFLDNQLNGMRAKRFFQKTGKKITINGSDTVGYDKAKVECFNCHKMGHFARECRVPMNQENITRIKKLQDGQDILIKDSEIVVLKSKLEKISKEKDDIEIKLKKFKNAYQSLDKLIGSQITDKKFAEPSVERYKVKPVEVVTQTSSVEISEHVKENNDAPLNENWESEKEDEVESPPEIERKTVEPSVDKARCKYHQRERMVNGTNHSRVNHSANTIPKVVLTRTGLKPVNTVRLVNPKSTRRENKGKAGHSHNQLEDQGYFNSGCSRHMTGNISYLTDFKEFDGGYVAFGGGAKGGKITGKGIIRTATKDETSRILKSFITEIEKLVDKKIKIIRCDNRPEFKNRVMNEFCEEKGIKREYSIARTPQQNKNKVLVVKPHFKTPYELFRGRTPALSFMRPFGCHVTILNTVDHLGKFDGKSDEGFFVGYSTNSKPFRVYNTRTRNVEKNLHINFLENKPIIAGDGPTWLFDIDSLTESMNYVPVIACTNSNDFAGKRASFNAGQSSMKTGLGQDYILMPLWNDGSIFDSSSKDSDGDNKDNDGPCKESEIDNQERPIAENSTKDVNNAGPSINTASSNINTASLTVNIVRQSDDFFGVDNDMRSLDGVEVDISNIFTTYHVPATPNTRIHKDHSFDNVIGDM
nr:hypothetical protein [Tanacetum cinerariifolium]